MRVGQGFDAHRLVAGRALVLGGVDVPHDKGLEGHSDGDALLHAVTDALIGALGLGDLGTHFPSSDESLAGVASHVLLEKAVAMMTQRHYRIANVDATIIAQAPRLASHQPRMKSNLVGWLGTTPDRVNVKVTSTDHLGALGREEGIAALAVLLLEKIG